MIIALPKTDNLLSQISGKGEEFSIKECTGCNTLAYKADTLETNLPHQVHGLNGTKVPKINSLHLIIINFDLIYAN